MQAHLCGGKAAHSPTRANSSVMAAESGRIAMAH